MPLTDRISEWSDRGSSVRVGASRARLRGIPAGSNFGNPRRSSITSCLMLAAPRGAACIVCSTVPSALAPFEAFLEAIRTATNEDAKRHLFTVLASTGFGDTAFARELALGSEYQVRFRDAGLVRRGAIDSFYGSLVIEFERDLNATGAHALDQLRWYVAGAWTEDGSTRRDYLAVATDGLHWQILVPSLIDPSLGVDAENVHLALSETWAPRGDLEFDAAGLRDFLNRIVFRSDILRPSAMNFARDFGLASPAYLAASRELVVKLAELETNETRQLLQSKWSVTLQDAYGSVDTDDELFVKHTYLAVLSRLLVWAALEKRAPSASELSSILNGNYFVGRRISNLVEDDFFRWPDLPSSTDAGHAWTALASHLLAYDLASVSEDVLKPLYEQLVDPRTRHDLGEYYTPDWLAERMTERLLNDWDWSSGAAYSPRSCLRQRHLLASSDRSAALSLPRCDR